MVETELVPHDAGLRVMARRLSHPWWVHLPAILLLLAMVVVWSTEIPLPANVPLHFNLFGKADSWGSSWLLAALVFLIPLIVLAISVILDESWARQESIKQFNWMSLFDDAVVGLMAALVLRYLQLLHTPDGSYHFPWLSALLFTGGAVMAAIILESLRPWRPFHQQLVGSVAAQAAEIDRRLAMGEPFRYEEKQTPVWLGMLITLVSALLATGAIIDVGLSPYFLLVNLGLVSTLFYGGLYITVTREHLAVRVGVRGVRILTLAVRDLVEVRVATCHEVAGQAPLFLFHGKRGVLLRAALDRQYLLGSDHPERLAAVIQAVCDHRD